MTCTPLSRQIQATLSRLWQALESDGLPPCKAIEQISYLLVLKQMERRGEWSGPIGWSVLQVVPQEHLMSTVSEAVATLRDRSGISVFERAQLSISKPPLLREAMMLIDELFPAACSPEQHASRYDALLLRAEEAAHAWAAPGGKFYSPHHIAHLLCSLVRPQVGERICDPACGNGRLLASAHAHIVRLQCDPEYSGMGLYGARRGLRRVASKPSVFGEDRRGNP